MQGTVKWFDPAKGYGFISPKDGGKDIFVHHTGIKMEGYRDLKEGQEVEYIVAEGDKGPMAANVVPSVSRKPTGSVGDTHDATGRA